MDLWYGHRIVSARLAGRCANGAERDGGKLHHAVPMMGDNANTLGSTALCGATFGRRSAGWVWETAELSCPKCIRKLRHHSKTGCWCGLNHMAKADLWTKVDHVHIQTKLDHVHIETDAEAEEREKVEKVTGQLLK